jgi:hypothetical protein
MRDGDTCNAATVQSEQLHAWRDTFRTPCSEETPRLKIVPNRFQRAHDVLVLQMDLWAVAYLNGRRMVSIPLAKTGDSDRRQMLSEYALVSRNEKVSGGVFDLTTS